MKTTTSSVSGFTLVELIMALTLTAFLLGVAVAAFSGALGSRDRESSRADALTSAQAALNIMSREIGNAGYGLMDNGVVTPDSTNQRLHVLSNIDNVGDNGTNLGQPGEDILFSYDAASQSIVRYDQYSGTTSGLVNRISSVAFTYRNYVYDPATGTTTESVGAAGPDTGKITIDLTVTLPDARGQTSGRQEKLSSQVTLRNSSYMLQQY